jgi:hypothetical protein
MNSRIAFLLTLLVLLVKADAGPVRFVNEGYEWKPYISDWESGFAQDIHYLDVRKPWNEQTIVPNTALGVDAPPSAVVYERRDFGSQFPSFDMITGVIDSAPAWKPDDPRSENSTVVRVFYGYDLGGTVPSATALESFEPSFGRWFLGPVAELIYRFNPNNPSGFPLPTQSFMRPRDIVGIRMVVPGGFQYGWIEMELISIDDGARPIAWGYETEINMPAVIIPEPWAGFAICAAVVPLMLTSRRR